MTTAAHLGAMFAAAPIVLWVEDSLTRDYLSKAWNDDPDIVFFLAGNSAAVRPIVEAARVEGINHVFGVVDRDLGITNRAKWPNVMIFRLPRHEVENYLLDQAAILGCGLNNRGRTAGQVTAEMSRLANLQPCWLACRHVLNQLRQAVLDNFPSHLTPAGLPTIAAAAAHITASPWYVNLPPSAAHWTGAGIVNAALTAAENVIRGYLAGNAWLEEYSGKEIFRPLRDYVYTHLAGSTPDNDFAKAIGTWQRLTNVVPQDIVDLRSALRQQVRLPP